VPEKGSTVCLETDQNYRHGIRRRTGRRIASHITSVRLINERLSGCVAISDPSAVVTLREAGNSRRVRPWACIANNMPDVRLANFIPMMGGPVVKLFSRYLALLIVSINTAFLAGCSGDVGPVTADPRLPQALQDASIRAQNEGTNVNGLLQVIHGTYGEPVRRIGEFERWEVDGGVLTYDPIAGIYFVTPNGEMVRLMHMHNPLDVVIYCDYEMHENGQGAWIGNMELRTNGTYQFVFPFGRPPKPVAEYQKEYFFVHHLRGEYKLLYLTSFGSGSLLENVQGHERIAKLEFHADDGFQKTFFLAKDPTTGRLIFESDEPIPFHMTSRPWSSLWW
jgi:hypothetical protein